MITKLLHKETLNKVQTLVAACNLKLPTRTIIMYKII